MFAPQVSNAGNGRGIRTVERTDVAEDVNNGLLAVIVLSPAIVCDSPAQTLHYERFGPARERAGDLGPWHETKIDLPRLARATLRVLWPKMVQQRTPALLILARLLARHAAAEDAAAMQKGSKNED